MDSVRVAIDVHAGLLPGTPEPGFSKRWHITSEEWEAATAKGGDAQAALLAMMNGRAQGWASYLMLQPDRLNWVKTEWVWF